MVNAAQLATYSQAKQMLLGTGKKKLRFIIIKGPIFAFAHAIINTHVNVYQ